MLLNGLIQKGYPKRSILENYQVIYRERVVFSYYLANCMKLVKIGENIWKCLKMSFENFTKCMREYFNSSTLLTQSRYYFFALSEKVGLKLVVLAISKI